MQTLGGSTWKLAEILQRAPNCWPRTAAGDTSVVWSLTVCVSWQPWTMKTPCHGSRPLQSAGPIFLPHLPPLSRVSFSPLVLINSVAFQISKPPGCVLIHSVFLDMGKSCPLLESQVRSYLHQGFLHLLSLCWTPCFWTLLSLINKQHLIQLFSSLYTSLLRGKVLFISASRGLRQGLALTGVQFLCTDVLSKKFVWIFKCVAFMMRKLKLAHNIFQVMCVLSNHLDTLCGY